MTERDGDIEECEYKAERKVGSDCWELVDDCAVVGSSKIEQDNRRHIHYGGPARFMKWWLIYSGKLSLELLFQLL